MPRMVSMIPNPKPSAEMKKDPAWAEISKMKPRKVSFTTAMENMRLSHQMLVIAPEDDEFAVPEPMSLEDRSREELIVMYLGAGGKLSKKRIEKPELISFIRDKIAEADIVDE